MGSLNMTQNNPKISPRYTLVTSSPNFKKANIVLRQMSLIKFIEKYVGQKDIFLAENNLLTFIQKTSLCSELWYLTY